jgi:hypothetical protein
MTQQQLSLQGHISDMKAATDHLCEAFTRQGEDRAVQANSHVATLIGRMQQVTEQQSSALKKEMERFGAEAAEPIKHALAAMTGSLAGLYGRVRPDTVSRMLRDDYTALSLASVSNSMLHVTALAGDDALAAALALRNMEQLAPLIIEVGEAVLAVVEQELNEEFSPRPGVSARALENVRQVWSPSGSRV